MNILKINGQALEGIYVDAAISFNKPAKRVSTYSVPGRNGDLVIDEGTFDNVLITYPVFEKSTFPTKFDEIVNYLASLEGYQRIECSNDPQHYRLGRFVVPQNPTAKRLNRDGYWQLSFDCKPQRWLLSGEEDTEIDANPIDEYRGDIVSFEAVALDEITELKAAIEPVQSGSGDPSPTNIRPISGHTEVNVTRTGKNLVDVDDVSLGGGNTRTKTIDLDYALPSGTYYFDWTWGGTGTRGGVIVSSNGTQLGEVSKGEAFVATSPITRLYFYMNATDYNNGKTMTFSDIIISTSSAAYEPYAGQTYPISLGQTVYGGKVDTKRGKVTITHGYKDLGDMAWSYQSQNVRFASTDLASLIKPATSASTAGNIICSIYKTVSSNDTISIDCSIAVSTSGNIQIKNTAYSDAATFKTAMSGVQLVYELATPIEVDIEAVEIAPLVGDNNIWADCGDVEVKVTTPTVFNNPSPFNSKPLIRVYGVGTFRVNDITVTIASHDKPYIDIDCELQECYYGSENMNEYVSFSGNDFPELQPGDNYMLLASGITKLDVTPRWWVL